MHGRIPAQQFPAKLGIPKISQNGVGAEFVEEFGLLDGLNTAVRWLSDRLENRVAGGNICRIAMPRCPPSLAR